MVWGAGAGAGGGGAPQVKCKVDRTACLWVRQANIVTMLQRLVVGGSGEQGKYVRREPIMAYEGCWPVYVRKAAVCVDSQHKSDGRKARAHDLKCPYAVAALHTHTHTLALSHTFVGTVSGVPVHELLLERGQGLAVGAGPLLAGLVLEPLGQEGRVQVVRALGSEPELARGGAPRRGHGDGAGCERVNAKQSRGGGGSAGRLGCDPRACRHTLDGQRPGSRKWKRKALLGRMQTRASRAEQRQQRARGVRTHTHTHTGKERQRPVGRKLAASLCADISRACMRAEGWAAES